MMIKLYCLYAILWLSVTIVWRPVLSAGTKKYSEIEASKYLDNANYALTEWTNRVIHANWNWLTNLTNENAEKKVLAYYLLRFHYKHSIKVVLYTQQIIITFTIYYLLHNLLKLKFQQ